MKNKQVGNPSSRYAYNPDELDIDYKDKSETIENTSKEYQEQLLEMLKKKIEYKSGCMTIEQKIRCLMVAVAKIKEEWE